MKTILSFVLAFGFSCSALAFGSSTTQVNWEKRAEAHTKKLEALDEQISTSRGVIDSVLKDFDEIGCDFSSGRVVGCKPDQTTEEKLRLGNSVAKMFAHQETLDGLEKERERLNAQGNQIQERERAKAESAIEEKNPMDGLSAALNALQADAVQDEMNEAADEVKEELSEAIMELNRIEDKYDQEEIGIYFQDKMGQFVNSSLFCHARKRCMVEERKEVDSKYMKELFPYMDEKNSRSSKQYYDRTKGRRSSGNK